MVKFKEKNAKLEEKFEIKKLKEKFKLKSRNLRKKQLTDWAQTQRNWNQRKKRRYFKKPYLKLNYQFFWGTFIMLMFIYHQKH